MASSVFEMDKRPYFQILHNLIRHSELGYDPDRAAETIEWVRDHAMMLLRTNSTPEHDIIVAIYAYWDRHKSLPSRNVLNELIRDKQKIQDLLDVMGEYDKYEADLEEVPALDLDLYLAQRKAEWEKRRCLRVLDIARAIAVSSMEEEDKRNRKKIIWEGPRDALRYIHKVEGIGMFLDDSDFTGGDLAGEIVPIVADSVLQAANGYGNAIQTLTPIDRAMSIGPESTLRLIELAGYTNQRKSTLAFTLAFQAAVQGYKVCFVALEGGIENAGIRFAYLWAYHTNRELLLPRLADAMKTQYATREHSDIIRGMEEEMREAGIRIDVRDASDWGSIKACVNSHLNDPYDALFIDYLAHVKVPGARLSERVESINALFKEAQLLSLKYERGNKRKGLVVFTPVQVGKKSEKVAADVDAPLGKGIYPLGDIGIIDWYTDAGRDADAIIGCWSGDVFRERGLVRISCVKSKQEDFQPFFMRVDPHTQMMVYCSDSDALAILEGSLKNDRRDLERNDGIAPARGSKSVSPEMDAMEKYI